MLKILNNKFILGTVQMGLPYGINNSEGQISLDNSLAILNHAYDSGIEILDSAEAYGNAHEVIGEFHKQYLNKRFKIITKLPNQPKEDILKKVDTYLNQLGVNQLHGLLFHSFSSYKSGEAHFKTLRKLKFEGKIKNIGVSVYTNAEIDEVLLDDEVSIIQAPFNLLDNNNLRAEVFGKAKAKGKIIHTRSALLQGLFFKSPTDSNNVVKNLKNELLFLKEISKGDDIPISSLALNYCLDQQNIDNVLIGVDSLIQLKDNLNATTFKLNIAVLEKIDSIKVKNLDFLNPSLWK